MSVNVQCLIKSFHWNIPTLAIVLNCCFVVGIRIIKEGSGFEKEIGNGKISTRRLSYGLFIYEILHDMIKDPQPLLCMSNT